MKGAKPVPERTTSRPRSNSARRSGSSHHFLLCFRKPHNSRKKPTRPCSAAACSNGFGLGSLMVGGCVGSVLGFNTGGNSCGHPGASPLASRSFGAPARACEPASHDLGGGKQKRWG